MNLPNALSGLRIFLVPWRVVLLLTRTERGWMLGICVFAIGVATDYLDGWFARRRNERTALGAILDPLADKLLISAALVSLVELDTAPAWIVVLIIGREFAVTWLRAEAMSRGAVMVASVWGKAKTVAQIVAIFLMMLGLRVEWCAQAAVPALYVALGLTVFSAWDYFRAFGGRGSSPA